MNTGRADKGENAIIPVTPTPITQAANRRGSARAPRAEGESDGRVFYVKHRPKHGPKREKGKRSSPTKRGYTYNYCRREEEGKILRTVLGSLSLGTISGKDQFKEGRTLLVE
jgi:hypothetical protein